MNLGTLFILAPLIGALLVWLAPPRLLRPVALLATLAGAGLGLAALLSFIREPGADFRFLEEVELAPAWGVAWRLGFDGLGAALAALSGVVGAIAVGASWTVEKRERAYFSLLLVLCAGMNGVFCALDFVLFYVAWELVLLPMFVLIAVWGGEGRRYAAIKFVVYSLAGSLLMLVPMLGAWAATPSRGAEAVVAPAMVQAQGTPGRYAPELHGLRLTVSTPAAGGAAEHVAAVPRSFDLRHLPLLWRRWQETELFGVNFAWLGFWCLVIACLIKVPSVPFHTWLPHAHVQAPTAVSVILAGVLLKLGVFGLYRIAWPMFPVAAHEASRLIGALGVAGILWGAWVALGQRDFKRMVAYSSVSHMGYCLLGLAAGTAAGLAGGAVQAVTHGLGSAMLFLLVGVIYDRAHHRRLDGFGGLARTMPVYAFLLSLGALAAAGLPGLAGFPGELLAVVGAVGSADPALRWQGLVACLGGILSAAYLLWALKRVAFGPLAHPEQASYPDCDAREGWCLWPLAALIVLVGVWPQPLLDAVGPGCRLLVDQLAFANGGRP